MKTVLVLIILALIGALGYIVYDKVLYGPSTPPTVVIVNTTTTEPVACTTDAKLCPDGSYVSRSGPTCEFAACPPAGDDVITPPPVEGMANWQTSSSAKLSFRFPADFGTTYIHAQDWPPMLVIATTPYSCTVTGSETTRAGQTTKVVMRGQEYCRTLLTEGAAGSVYKQYAYKTVQEGKNVILTFTTREVQCGNYNDTARTDCEAERQNFNIDSVAAQILRTVEFK